MNDALTPPDPQPPTPLVDERSYTCAAMSGPVFKDMAGNESVDADFARDLERQLHIARASIEDHEAWKADRRAEVNAAKEARDIALQKLGEVESERNEWKCSALLYHSELRDLSEGKKVETQLGFPVEQLIRNLRTQLAEAHAAMAAKDKILDLLRRAHRLTCQCRYRLPCERCDCEMEADTLLDALALTPNLPTCVAPVSVEEANELQDILHTLTNSGTALKTSARELVAALTTARAQLAERDEQIAFLTSESCNARTWIGLQSQLTAANERITGLEREVEAILNAIPNPIRVHEGNGPDNLLASLAVSVAAITKTAP